jgi:hypothetical protein
MDTAAARRINNFITNAPQRVSCDWNVSAAEPLKIIAVGFATGGSSAQV